MRYVTIDLITLVQTRQLNFLVYTWPGKSVSSGVICPKFM